MVPSEWVWGGFASQELPRGRGRSPWAPRGGTEELEQLIILGLFDSGKVRGFHAWLLSITSPQH